VPASARKLLVPGLALAAVIIGVVALIASSGSDSSRKTAAAPTPAPAPKAQTAPKPRAKTKPTRAKPKAKPRPAAKRPAASAKSLGSGTLQTGSKGVDVKLLQKLLKVQVSGTFGPKTEAAVRAFQGKHHLPPTGVVAALTHKALKKAFP
jgi:peptidoglycan hydrolase-like protein with peptidoglycan-binding domain